jgi:hypothetical protein
MFGSSGANRAPRSERSPVAPVVYLFYKRSLACHERKFSQDRTDIFSLLGFYDVAELSVLLVEPFHACLENSTDLRPLRFRTESLEREDSFTYSRSSQSDEIRGWERWMRIPSCKWFL